MECSATEARDGAGIRRAGILLAATALSTLLCACAAPKHRQQGPLLLHPVPPILERYALSQGALIYSEPGFTVSVRPWDFRLVGKEFRSAGEPNPFGDTDEAVGRFLFLRVRLENRSPQSLVFNPMRASLISQGAAPLVPLENSDLLFFADDKTAEAEARGSAFRRVCFDNAVTLRPGQTLERYLAFEAPAEGAKQYGLVLEDLWLGSKSYDLKFGFEAFPGN